MLPQNCTALVLNADLRPVRLHPLSVWGLERTMTAVMRGRVAVLQEHDAELRSARLTWRPPSVVMLKRFVKIPNKVPFNRFNIHLRDDFRCQYCGNEFHTRDLTFDHVVPRCRGGGTTFENIVSACVPCNSAKGHKLLKPLQPPKTPDPRELFRKAQSLKQELHADWVSYLYWSGVLDQDG